MPTTEANHDEALHLELARRLGPSPADPWRVDAVLKESPAETTQLVWLRTASGTELGPYVRKVIEVKSGLGGVWRRLAECQNGGLRSRQLPRIVDCEEGHGTLSVVMERVVGPSLRQRVLEAAPYQRESLAARLIPGLCSAAAELSESLGEVVVHRDITPSNVICSGLGADVPVLVDLDIARVWDEGSKADTTHFGTRAYAPPEQFGFGQTDARCDVYAIGMCALFCLTGRDPAPEDREAGFDVPGVPAPWRTIIARACAFDPAERYVSARELGEAVSAALSADPSQAPLSHSSHHERGRAFAREALLRVWHARNVVIIPVMAILVWASTSNVFDPAALNRGNPWLNAFGYLIYVNYCILALGYALMDKRWLRTHVRIVREWSRGRMALTLVGIFVALTSVLVILAGATGAS